MEHGRKTENETLDALLESLGSRETPEEGGGGSLPELERRAEDGVADGDAGEEEAGPSGALRGDLLRHVKLKAKVELGRTRMPLGAALGLSSGSVIDLGKEAGGPVDILVNDVPIARGQIIVVDGTFCVRVTRVLSPEEGGGLEA